MHLESTTLFVLDIILYLIQARVNFNGVDKLQPYFYEQGRFRGVEFARGFLSE